MKKYKHFLIRCWIVCAVAVAITHLVDRLAGAIVGLYAGPQGAGISSNVGLWGGVLWIIIISLIFFSTVHYLDKWYLCYKNYELKRPPRKFNRWESVKISGIQPEQQEISDYKKVYDNGKVTWVYRTWASLAWFDERYIEKLENPESRILYQDGSQEYTESSLYAAQLAIKRKDKS